MQKQVSAKQRVDHLEDMGCLGRWKWWGVLMEVGALVVVGGVFLHAYIWDRGFVLYGCREFMMGFDGVKWIFAVVVVVSFAMMASVVVVIGN